MVQLSQNQSSLLSSQAVFIAMIFTVVVACGAPASAQPPPNRSMQEGITFYNQGRYMESLGKFNQAKATDSDNALLHYYMASALLKLNHKDDAIREYKMTLLLEPQGRLTSLCETALQALGAGPAKPVTAPKSAIKPGGAGKAGLAGGGTAAGTGAGTGTAASGRTAPGGKPVALETSRLPGGGYKQAPKSAALQTAKCVAVLCGCPLCSRLSLTLTDLNSKFGDKIEFQRTTMNATDDKSKELIGKYSVRQCPTVLLISERGEHATEYHGNIVEKDLTRDVEEMAKSATRLRYTTVEDKNLASMRKMVIDEVEARISHDVGRVDFQVKRIQQELDEGISSHPRQFDAAGDPELLRNEAERKIKAIRDDFERRKREWYAAAEERIRGISSTGPAK
ncbi:MAG: hypothetical protein SGJ27_18105 [Candidatus Melainabacteria bacterium]|nr:hypothetical protein [Candidatus Melainabacteria bacterium]